MTITRIGQLIAGLRVTTEPQYYVGGAINNISTVQVNTGTYSYVSPNANGTSLMGVAVEQNYDTFRVGYWVRHVGVSDRRRGNAIYAACTGRVPFESPLICIFADGVGNNLILARPIAGTLNLYEELSVQAAPTRLFTQNAWIHIGIVHKLAQFDGFISVYIDGDLAFSYTGDTRMYGQNNGFPVFGVNPAFLFVAGAMTNTDSGSGGNAGGFQQPSYLDDLFFDAYQSEADAPVPARRFLVVFPTGAGASSQLTPTPAVANWNNVKDNPHDSDLTYNKATAANLKDLYIYGDITLPTDYKIVAAIVAPWIKRLDSEIQSGFRALAYDGLNTLQSDILIPPMSYSRTTFARVLLQPDGSLWTETAFNAMQFGILSAGDFG